MTPESLTPTPAMPVATYYYLSDWTDETMPCQPTLESWAEWLSKPDAEWARDEAAETDTLFKGTTLEVLADLQFSVRDGVVSLPALPEGADQAFIRYGGPDSGWDADSSTYSGAHFPATPEGFRQDVEKLIGEELFGSEGEGYVALVRSGPSFVARYTVTAGGPRLEIEATVQ